MLPAIAARSSRPSRHWPAARRREAPRGPLGPRRWLRAHDARSSASSARPDSTERSSARISRQSATLRPASPTPTVKTVASVAASSALTVRPPGWRQKPQAARAFRRPWPAAQPHAAPRAPAGPRRWPRERRGCPHVGRRPWRGCRRARISRQSARIRPAKPTPTDSTTASVAARSGLTMLPAAFVCSGL